MVLIDNYMNPSRHQTVSSCLLQLCTELYYRIITVIILIIKIIKTLMKMMFKTFISCSQLRAVTVHLSEKPDISLLHNVKYTDA